MRTFSQKLSVFCLFLVLGFLHFICAKDLGKLECTENEGMKPDSKLLNLIISKCQPKQGQNDSTTAACLIKCLMKQQKALDKKGKMNAKKAAEVVDVFPEQFKESVSARFNECCTEHNNKLTKEASGCGSWIPFSDCFFSYSKGLCPTLEQRNAMANTTTDATEAPA